MQFQHLGESYKLQCQKNLINRKFYQLNTLAAEEEKSKAESTRWSREREFARNSIMFVML